MRYVLKSVLLIASMLCVRAADTPKPLQSIQNCTYVDRPWNDGDSFAIKTPTGEEHTIRLYGVDCLELHVADNDRNLIRLREQRRYFGINDAGKDLTESMKIAGDFAKQAASFSAKNLKDPFTVHTRFSDGAGDPKFKRVMAFVTLSDGRDLATALVQEGLARAQGRGSNSPSGNSMNESKALLTDLEIQAMKNDRGIWKKTNWEKLPEERRKKRIEDAEAKVAKQQKEPKAALIIDPNCASREDLIKLPEIAGSLADRIIQFRKKTLFKKPEDLGKVPGIDAKTIEVLRPHLKFNTSEGQPKP